MPAGVRRSRRVSRLSPAYWRFWSAAAASNLADGIRLTAFPLLAASFTRDPLAVGVVGGIGLLPWVVAGPLGGVLADRVDRRRVIVSGHAGRALVVGAFAAAVWLDVGGLPLLYAVAFAVGVGEVVVDTASQAAIPLLAPAGPDGLDLANSRLVAVQVLLNEIAGAPLGGVLFALGAAVPFGVDATMSLVAIALLASVRTPLQRPRPAAGRSGVLEEIRTGLAFVWERIALRRLAVAVALVNGSLSGAMGLLVLLALDDLGLSEAGFGLLLGIGAVGGLAGSIVVRRLTRRHGRAAVLTATTAMVGAGIGAIALAGDVVVVGGLLFAVMSAVMGFNVAGQSLRQAMTPDELLGRVVASFRLVGMAGGPVGAVLGGVAGSLVGVRFTFAAAGALAAGAAALVASAGRHIPAEATGTG